MPPNWVFWVVFNAFVLLMLVLDLGVFHRKSHVVHFLFGIGYIIFGHAGKGIALLAVAALCATFIFWDLGRRGWEALSGEE